MDGPVGTSRSAKGTHWNCRWASRFGVAGKSIPSVSANLLSQAVGDAEYALEFGGLRATGIFSASFKGRYCDPSVDLF